MKRYIIVSRAAGVYDGVYYSTRFLEPCKRALMEKWPGLDWQIEETECGFPVPGLAHLGEVRATGILKRYQPGDVH